MPLQQACGKLDRRAAHLQLERYAHTARSAQLQEVYRAPERSLRETLQGDSLTVHWAQARLVADDPGKASARSARGVPQVMLDALNDTWRQARYEVLAASAYFVPGRRARAT